MKKKSMVVISSVFLTGFLIGSITPTKVGSAANDVVLASVEWVQNQLNPLQSKVTKLESEVQALRKAVEEGGSVVTMPSKVFVSSTTATVHRGATRDYEVVATFTKGKELAVIGEHDGSKGKWYRVEYATGKYGWIHSEDISTSTVSNVSTVTITTTTTVHRGALSGYATVATVKAGTSVKYIGSFTNGNNELWYNVELSNGVKGWMQAAHGEVN